MAKKSISAKAENQLAADKIGNRFILNFTYTAIAYILLFAFYKFATVFMGAATSTVKVGRGVLVVVFVIFALAAIGLYVWAKLCRNFGKKSVIKNHAHMMVGFAVGSFLINFPTYNKLLIKPVFPVESTSGFFRSVLGFFTTTQNNYKLVAILIGVTFVALCIKNFVDYKKISK